MDPATEPECKSPIINAFSLFASAESTTRTCPILHQRP